MKVLSAIMFLLGLVVLAFTITVSVQFHQLARSANPEPSPLVEKTMGILVSNNNGGKPIKPAQMASQFQNRLMLIGVAGAMFCAIAAFAYFAARSEGQRNAPPSRMRNEES